MEFIQILDFPARPGALAEWIPSAPGGLGSWQRDPRATSHNHEHHLRSAHDYRARTGRQGGQESWLGIAVEFDEQISVAAVHAALAAWIDRHEVLRTHVSLADGHTERYTTGPGNIHLRMRRIGWYSDPDLLVEQIAGSFDRATAPLHWPAYRFATVARAHSFTLLFAADHSLVDGYSLINAQHELRELYDAQRRSRPADLPAVGSYVDFSSAERAATDAADPGHTAAALWREFLDDSRSLPEFELLALPRHRRDPATTGDPAHFLAEHEQWDHDYPAQPSCSAVLLDAAATTRLAERCAALGGSLIGGILAAAAMVYHRQGGGDRFATVMPRHTRNHTEFHTALGWFVGLAPVSVDVADDPDFPTALERVMVSLDRAREGSTLPLLRLAELVGFDPEPKFAVSFIDTRGVPGAVESDAGAARVLRSHTYADDEVYLWINRTPSGLRMHARFPADTAAHPHSSTMTTYFVGLAAMLTDLAGGLV